jgi:hypothetical protein
MLDMNTTQVITDQYIITKIMNIDKVLHRTY